MNHLVQVFEYKKYIPTVHMYIWNSSRQNVVIQILSNGTVSAKIAPRLKCYKNASSLNRYNFPTDNAIDFTTPFHYEVLKIRSVPNVI